jgi:hypothetical protein
MSKKNILAMLALLAAASLGLAAQQEQRKSPHESTSITLNGNEITITYGRPSLRGRKAVGGSLAPFGKVWRTGADEATKLTTNADLTIGDLKAPKGTYALFTIPEKDHWTLIVNKTADQWGAFSYDSSKDLGRTQMKVTELSSPVEEFTISLKPASGSTATLTMAWENTEVSVPVKSM